MPGFLKSLGKLFIYKEPKNNELGFELLEDKKEGNENEFSQASSNTGVKKKPKERKIRKVQNIEPVPLQKWNENRKNGSASQSQPQNQAKGQTREESAGQTRGQAQGRSGGNSQGQSGGNSKGQPGDNSQGQSANNSQSQSDNQSQGRSRRRSRNKPQSKTQSNQQDQQSESSDESQQKGEAVTSDLSVNLEIIRKKFDMPKNIDVVIREFKIGRKIKASLVYTNGMVDSQIINFAIFPRLMSKEVSEEITSETPIDYLVDNVLAVLGVKRETRFQNIIAQILSGFSALFIEGSNECILLETKGYEKRSIDSPLTENIVQGPQEGFTEDLRTNLSLVRRIIRSEKLISEIYHVGKANNGKCAVMYIEGIADQRVVNEVKKRIKSIDTDFILGSGMIEQFIEDNPFMLFPQVMNTERPDRAASFLVGGQVVIIAEGSPFAIAAPVTFFGLLHSSEESFTRWPYGTFLRLIRMFGLFCATLLPGLYVAMIMFHPDVVPTELLISIAQSRESVPFPTIIEVLMMELAFELIREGGIRVPRIIGQTLGIVGALILGQAAVAAGLVSPFVVIIVSVTALGSFVIPNYSLGLAIRIERFLFILMGAFMGFYSLAITFFLLAALTCSMKSFGVPFISPVAPKTRFNPDVVLKMPVWAQKNRPDYMQSPNRKSQGNNVKMWFAQENTDGKGGDGRE